MHIGKPVISHTSDQTRYEVKTDKGPLWFSVQPQFSSFLSDSSDAALTGLLIPAMIRGEDIEIAGNVSARLHYHLNGRVQSIIRGVLPDLKHINIVAPALTEDRTGAAGVATGFSGGIDSYCVIADHLLSECNPRFRLTHLLYNDVGAHGTPGKFDAYFDKISKAAAPLGLAMIKVASNLETFYPPVPTFQQTHSLRNAAVAQLLQGGIGKFLYASTYQFADLKFTASNDIGFTDAACVPLLSTESVACLSVGSEYTRVGKTLKVACHPESYSTLDVCTGEDHHANCSACFKCLRTMLTLDIAGKLDLYSGVFDLTKYRERREWYVGHVLAADDPFSREIATLIRETGYKIPLGSRRHQIQSRVRQAVGR